MKWFFRGLFAVLLVGGWVAAARSFHIIHGRDLETGQDRFGIVPKARWVFADTYVDVRAWTPADLKAHEELVRHLSRSPKADLLSSVVPKEKRGDPAAWILLALDNPAATQAAVPATQPQ